MVIDTDQLDIHHTDKNIEDLCDRICMEIETEEAAIQLLAIIPLLEKEIKDGS
jgi:hypothetical protein